MVTKIYLCFSASSYGHHRLPRAPGMNTRLSLDATDHVTWILASHWTLFLSPGATHGKWDEHSDLHFLRLQPPRGDLLVARRGQDLQHGVPGEELSDEFFHWNFVAMHYFSALQGCCHQMCPTKSSHISKNFNILKRFFSPYPNTAWQPTFPVFSKMMKKHQKWI